MPFKCLRNFWRPLEILLDKSKIDLKRKWSNRCRFSVNGNGNTDDNPNNIMFTMKDTKLHVSVVTLSLGKDCQKLS